MTDRQKLDMILEAVQKLKLSKNAFNKKCSPKLLCTDFQLKKIERFV